MMSARGISFLLILVTIMVALVPGTAPAGGKFTSSTVRYPSGKDTVSGYLCVPEGKGPFPGVMVIHEWWGLTPWVKEGAERLSKEGYVALAIDLYRGKVAETADDAHQLSRGVPEDRASRDLKAAYEYLKGRKDVTGTNIGSVGWCMGGGYSLEAAVEIPELTAAVVCYGRLVTDSSAIAGIGASVLGIFGGKDKGIPPESAMEFEGTAKGMGKDVNVTVYPEAGHAFMNSGNKDAYSEEDAKDAWRRILVFLADKFDNH